MGVYIPNITIPDSCDKCPFVEGDVYDGYCHISGKWFDDEYFSWHQYEEGDIDHSKPLNCPLVEVETPHGRLVDADEFRQVMYHECFETDSDLQKWDSGCWIRYKMFEKNMESAPTIIDKEELHG